MGGGLRTGLALLAASLIAGAAFAQSAPAVLTVIAAVPKDYHPKKTTWGEPDLRGTWRGDFLNFTPLQRTEAQGNRYWLTDEEFAARQKQLATRGEAYNKEIEGETLGQGHWIEPGKANRRTSFVIDPPNGRVPALTEEGKGLAATKRSSYINGQTYHWVTGFDTWDRCITRGLPASMFAFNYNAGIRIFQSPGRVAIQLELVHETRVIPTDGRPALPAQIDGWMGESRGHWENGTMLVVETTNFNGLASPANVGTWGSPRATTPRTAARRA